MVAHIELPCSSATVYLAMNAIQQEGHQSGHHSLTSTMLHRQPANHHLVSAQTALRTGIHPSTAICAFPIGLHLSNQAVLVVAIDSSNDSMSTMLLTCQKHSALLM